MENGLERRRQATIWISGEVEKYQGYIPEYVKEELELRRRKIELIKKNMRTMEMRKKGVMVSRFDGEDFGVETTFGRAILALGENFGAKKFHTYSDSVIRKNRGLNIMKNNTTRGKISLNSIKETINKYKNKGER